MKQTKKNKGNVDVFMGVPMTEIRPYIKAFEAMMNDLENSSTEEKIESIKNHLVAIPILMEENNLEALESCKLGIVKILASIN